MPAYNASGTIVETLGYVLSNLLESDEVIVVNYGSKDDTAEICRDIDPRIKVVTIDNSGPAKARNRGIKEATGELIAFCDADDVWLPGKLEKQKKLFQENDDLGLCFSDYQIVDKDGNIIIPSAVQNRQLPLEHSLASMLKTNPVMTSSAVVPRKILNEIGGFPQSYSEKLKIHLATEDYQTWLAIAERYKVVMVPEVLAGYKQLESGLFLNRYKSAEASLEVLGMRIKLMREIAARNPDKISQTELRNTLAEIYFRASYNDREAGYYKHSALNIIKSIANQPSRMKSYVTFAYLPVHFLKSFAKS